MPANAHTIRIKIIIKYHTLIRILMRQIIMKEIITIFMREIITIFKREIITMLIREIIIKGHKFHKYSHKYRSMILTDP